MSNKKAKKVILKENNLSNITKICEAIWLTALECILFKFSGFLY